MRRRRTRTALACCLGVLALGGCGNKHRVTTEAPTEGLWVDVGALDYHVQGSRQLNPAIVPDADFVAGLPQGILPPGARETWFGVFLRVENRTDEPHPVAEEIEIHDTEARIFRPLALRTEANPFAYAARMLPPNQSLPPADSVAEASRNGGLLLFKLPLDAYQNRPLELVIKAPAEAETGEDEPPQATIDLDV